MRASAAVLVVGMLVGACATGYHATGVTGGFKELQVGDRVYQVRYSGNGYTSHDRAADFLMRRCAELTLEHGLRYFTLRQDSGWGTMFPRQQAVIELLDTKAPGALDAVLIVQQTAERAHGKLSPAALETLRAMGEDPWPPKPQQ